MKTILALTRLLRLPNLVIVLLSQWLPYYFVLRPTIIRAGGVPTLGEQTFGFMTGGTVLCTLAGYIINDYFDRAIDFANKPDRAFIGNVLRPGFVLGLYWCCLVAIGLIGLWLDKHVVFGIRYWFSLLFGGVSIGLFLYSKVLKCTPLLGNITVALLCAIVPLVGLAPESRPIHLAEFQAPHSMQKAISLIWHYVFFAFSATLFREMVKDLEDQNGDAACQCRTFPVLKGVRFAQKWAFLVGLLLIVQMSLLLLSWCQTNEPTWKIGAGIGFLLLPAIFASEKTRNGKSKKDFAQASIAIKMVMLAGLFLLLL